MDSKLSSALFLIAEERSGKAQSRRYIMSGTRETGRLGAQQWKSWVGRAGGALIFFITEYNFKRI